MTADDIQTYTLIPDREIIIFFDTPSDEAPDQDVIDELEMQAYERQATPDLGLPAVVDGLMTLAQIAGQGMVGEASWVGLVATAAFLKRWRSGARRPLTNTQEATSRARQAAEAAISDHGTLVTLSSEDEGTTGWKVVFDVPTGGNIRVLLDRTGGIADVTVTTDS